MNPTRATPPVIDYERPGGVTTAGDVYRDGKRLVVRRGTDLSDVCLRCGRPAGGPGVIRRLSGGFGTGRLGFSSGPVDGVLGAILLVFALVQLVVLVATLIYNAFGRSERVLVVGLCEHHQRRLGELRRIALVGWWTLLAAATVGGAAIICRPRGAAAGVRLPVGCGVVAVVGLVCGVVGSGRPRLSLYREQDGWMWVNGASGPFLLAHRPWVGAPPAAATIVKKPRTIGSATGPALPVRPSAAPVPTKPAEVRNGGESVYGAA